MGTAAENPRVAVLGGGVAGVEAALALHELAGDRVALTLVSDRPDFTLKALTVDEPFSGTPASQYELAPVLDQLGGRFVHARATRVRTGEALIELDDGTDVPYDSAIVCVGARAVPAFESDRVTHLRAGEPLPIAELITRAVAKPTRTIAIVVPPGTTWPLPAYELALMTKHRAKEIGVYGLDVEVITPESSPLSAFGPVPSDAVSDLLSASGVIVRTGTAVTEDDVELSVEAGAVIALPRLEGPGVPGLPADDHGFLPTDPRGRLDGTSNVWAAGDGTSFPVKQGGLATQQADVAAAGVALELGFADEVEEFDPVLRAQLFTGGESLYLTRSLADPADRGQASWDCPWSPRFKVIGRHLPSVLGYELEGDAELPPRETVEVEAAMTSADDSPSSRAQERS